MLGFEYVVLFIAYSDNLAKFGARRGQGTGKHRGVRHEALLATPLPGPVPPVLGSGAWGFRGIPPMSERDRSYSSGANLSSVKKKQLFFHSGSRLWPPTAFQGDFPRPQLTKVAPFSFLWGPIVTSSDQNVKTWET